MTKDAPPLNSVLIVRLSAIGDVVHALPVLDALRTRLPDAKIGWVVEELAAPLLEHHPQLDRRYVIPKKRWKKNFRKMLRIEILPFFAQVRADGWDAALDLQGLTKSGLVARCSGAKIRAGYGDHDGREFNPLFTNRKVLPPSIARHVVQRNLEFLPALGLEPLPQAHGRLGLLEEEREAMRGRLRSAGWTPQEKLLGVNPGAGWSSKRWEPRRFAQAAAALAVRDGLRPLILWGPGEEEARDAIADYLRGQDLAFYVAPPTTVREMAVVISLCDLFLGGDTGPTHLAGILDVPTVAVFGASDAARNRPWPIKSGPALQRTDIDCVPCWRTQCPLQGDEYLKCLTGIFPETVVTAAEERLQP